MARHLHFFVNKREHRLYIGRRDRLDSWPGCAHGGEVATDNGFALGLFNQCLYLWIALPALGLRFGQHGLVSKLATYGIFQRGWDWLPDVPDLVLPACLPAPRSACVTDAWPVLTTTSLGAA